VRFFSGSGSRTPEVMTMLMPFSFDSIFMLPRKMSSAFATLP
jgi:hypothetical protein